MKNRKISSLGMSPGHSNKYPRGSSIKAWGCPRHPLFINKKHEVIFQCAIFLLLHALCVILGAYLFSVVCLLFLIKLDPSCFVLERDTLLDSYIEHSRFHFHCFLVFYFLSTAFSSVFSS